MKITEVLDSPLLYHGSKRSFPKGFILKPQSDGYVNGNTGDEFDEYIKKIEQVLETYRPQGVLPRNQSVFMCDTSSNIDYAGGRDDYVYLVKPLGPVFKSNLYWYGLIEANVYDDDLLEYEQWAKNYWMATPSGKKEIYEYRTTQAEIIKKTVFGTKQPLKRIIKR